MFTREVCCGCFNFVTSLEPAICSGTGSNLNGDSSLSRFTVGAAISTRPMEDPLEDDVLYSVDDPLEEDEFASVLEEKRRGNEAFQAGDWSRALDLYDGALDLYAARLGTPGVQLETRVTLLSNLAECALRLKDYDDAEVYANEALKIDEECVKARIRRVKAIVARLEGGGVSSSIEDIVAYLEGGGVSSSIEPKIEAARRDLERARDQLCGTPPDIASLERRINKIVAKKIRAEGSSKRATSKRALKPLMPNALAHPSPSEDVTPYPIPATTPRVRVLEPLLSAVQAAVDSAAPGTLVELCTGVFTGDEETLVLRKPVFLIGAGSGAQSAATTIDAKLVVNPVVNSNTKKVVTIKGLRVKKGATFERNRLARIDVLDSTIELRNMNDDCLEFNETPAKILVSGCTIIGGSDGLYIDTGNVHIYKSTIHSAADRGIFADSSFVIEDSTVKNCGSYGIKTRAGCVRRGKCNIQSGPWDHLDGGWGIGNI